MSDLPRSRGNRPVFTGHPALDDLTSILMALASEVAVLRQRCDTAEQLLVAKGLLAVDDIERYQPTPAVEIEREQWRRDYLDRVLFALRSRAEEERNGETLESYQQVLEEVAI